MTQTTQPGRPEPEWLPRRDDLAALLAAGGFPEGPGAWAVLEPSGPGGAGDVALVALRDVVWHPATGLVTQGGLPVFSPSNQIPDLGRALRRAGRGPVAALERAALWVSPGGLRNYGHFLFDGLTGLAALEEPRVTGRFRAVSGPLNGWQRELLAASGLRSEEITAETVEIGQVVYTTCMNSYLNRASALVPALAERFGRGGAAARGAVYLSRRGYTGRIMVNEAALEAALAAEGVRVLRPETMPVAAQIAAARGARVLIGASGAALSNALFLPPGGTLVELRPEPVNEPWMALTTAALGLRHRVLTLPRLVGAEVPPGARLRQLPRALTGRYHYCLRADIPAVLDALGEG